MAKMSVAAWGPVVFSPGFVSRTGRDLRDCFAALRTFFARGRITGSVMHHLFVLFSVLVLAAAGAEQHVAFDAARSSSTYSAGNLAGSPAFAAQQALSGGSGYWQSARLELRDVVLLVRLCCQVFQWRARSGPECEAENAL